MFKEVDSVIVSWDFSKGQDGKDHSVLLVGHQENNKMTIVNAYSGKQAKEIYKALIRRNNLNDIPHS